MASALSRVIFYRKIHNNKPDMITKPPDVLARRKKLRGKLVW
jgi:hypothetical protein